MSMPPEDSTPRLVKKPELLDEVVLRTNLKKRDVKPTVEAALAVIGEALRDGAELNVPPLGKLRLVKSKSLENGAAVMTLKLRTPKNASLAVAPDDDA
ncbi:HU family DNA-binding protein [Yoonia sp. F2084L]|uniref:HU family DNA-binding protein n=1 Tax=Yoonia sp. F2084L TaxID=2926419 RepID=UPI001FF64E11|nr:HU family DNA-binding protein [Yoonia sp. F2084L]MCK0094783.1 HU family DNA-binding protein [Yoonia sp. F2084L]